MDLEDAQQQQKVWVDSATRYPEVVLCVGKICFGEKARKNIPKKLKQEQKSTLACAVCALLNSGGGVVRAEIENENYTFEREGIGPDLEESFDSLVHPQTWEEYLDCKQRDNYLLLFVKTWSRENAGSTSDSARPRICSLSTGLSRRIGSRRCDVQPDKAFSFLRKKQEESSKKSEEALRELSPEPPAKIRTRAVEGDRDLINNAVEELFRRDRLRQGEKLNFTESGDVDFKHFATDKFLTRVKETLPQYISGFANARGGYLWIGVNDDRVVKGFSCDAKVLENLKYSVEATKTKLTLFHFCGRENDHDISYEDRIIDVYGETGDHRGYVWALKIEPFACVAFCEDPQSWLVEGGTVRRLRAREWAAWMTGADPELSKFADTFRLELSLTERPPLAKPVYSHRGLDSADELCKQLFPVQSRKIIRTPEKLVKDLLEEHPALDGLMQEQLEQLLQQRSQGVLVFCRSWAAEVGLPRNKVVICDALLIAKDSPPILYTVCQCRIPEGLFQYSRRVAQRLKEKLVNTGGYIHKLCVIPKLLALPPDRSCGEGRDLNIQELYPPNYGRINNNNLQALLRALTVALLTFESFLSDRVGCEFLNLLTIKQYQLLSENLHRTRKLYVYGLPGTGKTVVALKIIEKIREMLQHAREEVLYVCENQPLRDFVRQKNICRAVTREAFLKGSFVGVKHVIMDEAQNFRWHEGDWYEKAFRLTSSRHLPEPGFFWIFLDYLQTSHTFGTGLPPAQWHNPIESLTKVVRNASSIYSYLEEKMEAIVKNSTLNIPRERLERLLGEATCAHDVQGSIEEVHKGSRIETAKYVAERCRVYLKEGYSEKDIAVLCYTDMEAGAYREILASLMIGSEANISLVRMEEGPGEHAVLDSVRRFSGLERSIVFGIVPQSFPFDDKLLGNVLVCLASRANLKLHLVFEDRDYVTP